MQTPSIVTHTRANNVKNGRLLANTIPCPQHSEVSSNGREAIRKQNTYRNSTWVKVSTQVVSIKSRNVTLTLCPETIEKKKIMFLPCNKPNLTYILTNVWYQHDEGRRSLGLGAAQVVETEFRKITKQCTWKDIELNFDVSARLSKRKRARR
jgi:hypothetical protein